MVGTLAMSEPSIWRFPKAILRPLYGVCEWIPLLSGTQLSHCRYWTVYKLCRFTLSSFSAWQITIKTLGMGCMSGFIKSALASNPFIHRTILSSFPLIQVLLFLWYMWNMIEGSPVMLLLMVMCSYFFFSEHGVNSGESFKHLPQCYLWYWPSDLSTKYVTK